MTVIVPKLRPIRNSSRELFLMANVRNKQESFPIQIQIQYETKLTKHPLKNQEFLLFFPFVSFFVFSC